LSEKGHGNAVLQPNYYMRNRTLLKCFQSKYYKSKEFTHITLFLFLKKKKNTTKKKFFYKKNVQGVVESFYKIGDFHFKAVCKNRSITAITYIIFFCDKERVARKKDFQLPYHKSRSSNK